MSLSVLVRLILFARTADFQDLFSRNTISDSRSGWRDHRLSSWSLTQSPGPRSYFQKYHPSHACPHAELAAADGELNVFPLNRIVPFLRTLALNIFPFTEFRNLNEPEMRSPRIEARFPCFLFLGLRSSKSSACPKNSRTSLSWKCRRSLFNRLFKFSESLNLPRTRFPGGLPVILNNRVSSSFRCLSWMVRYTLNRFHDLR